MNSDGVQLVFSVPGCHASGRRPKSDVMKIVPLSTVVQFSFLSLGFVWFVPTHLKLIFICGIKVGSMFLNGCLSYLKLHVFIGGGGGQVGRHMPWYIYGCQTTTFKNWFSPTV